MNIRKRIIPVFFFLLIITGSLRLSVSMHYCGGKIADFAINLGKSKVSCGMETDESPCRKNGVLEKNCCKDLIKPIILTGNFIFSSIKSISSELQPVYFDEFASVSKISGFLVFQFKTIFSPSPPGEFCTLSFLQVFRL